jgi:hypothetical protein
MKNPVSTSQTETGFKVFAACIGSATQCKNRLKKPYLKIKHPNFGNYTKLALFY